MTKFDYIPYIDKRTNMPCLLENNPNELTKTFKYEDGKEKIVSIATFKRWYKKVENEPFVFKEKKTEDAPIEVEVDFTKEPTDETNINAVKTAVKELAKKIKEEKGNENTDGSKNDEKEGKQSKTGKKSGKRESKKNANVAVDKDGLTAEMFATIEKLVLNRLPAEFKVMSVAKKT